jgi:hypothetical protein
MDSTIVWLVTAERRATDIEFSAEARTTLDEGMALARIEATQDMTQGEYRDVILYAVMPPVAGASMMKHPMFRWTNYDGEMSMRVWSTAENRWDSLPDYSALENAFIPNPPCAECVRPMDRTYREVQTSPVSEEPTRIYNTRCANCRRGDVAMSPG